jgi:K+-transporting ATPase ATPase C chain
MKSLITSLRIFLFMTLLTGLVYPLLITGSAQLFFPYKANGSLIKRNGITVGSLLLGQQADSCPVYFSSRPSTIDYNPWPSGGSNDGLTSKNLKGHFKQRERNFINYNNLDIRTDVPSEMLFASASGLDPHISVLSALLQVERVSRARHFSDRQMDELVKLIDRMKEPPQLLFLGKERVNVLLLNLETDKIR